MRTTQISTRAYNKMQFWQRRAWKKGRASLIVASNKDIQFFIPWLVDDQTTMTVGMLIARRRKLDTFYYACVGVGGNGGGCHNDRKTHCNRDNQSVGPSFLLLSLRFVMIMWWRRLRVTDKWFRSSRHSPLFCLPRSIFSLRQCALFFSADTHGQEIFSIFHGNQARTRKKCAPVNIPVPPKWQQLIDYSSSRRFLSLAFRLTLFHFLFACAAGAEGVDGRGELGCFFRTVAGVAAWPKAVSRWTP